MLKIQVIKTSKDKIKQPKLSELGHIPKINTSTILSGRSGAGKSLLLANLIKRDDMLNGWFDEIFLISPSAESDDIQLSLNIPSKNVYTDPLKGIEKISEIMSIQKDVISILKADKAPKICVIFDDCISNKKLLNHKSFIDCFISNRHFNFTSFICSQSWTAIPRRCRLQANNIIFFAGSQDEVRILSETHTPPGYSKKEFSKIINEITKEPYSFLYINLSQPIKSRYRKTLEHIINI